jgi:Putative phage holin Dp-1
LINIGSSLYDRLKFLAQIGLPALGTLYFTLASIWGLPAAEQVVGTIVAVDVFLGVILQISSATYNNSDARFAGAINTSKTPEGLLYSLELNEDPESLKNKDEVTFKVNSPE